jgi:antibiotic biosynthesis monooxygenase (ABM) superfamily enzyme
MAYGHSFSEVTTATVRAEHWGRIEPLLQSWRSMLQDLPGYAGSEVMARRLENGDIRCQIRVTWLYPEQLEAFRAGPWASDVVIGLAAAPDPMEIETEAFEHFI